MLTTKQEAIVARIAAPRIPRAELAARLAHDEPMTRARAAMIHGAALLQVDRAFARLFPLARRERTY